MKKVCSAFLILVFLFLCGCKNKENSQTRFTLNTVSTISADCDNEVISNAFSLCESYEKLLSRTIENSDVYNINNTDGFVNVSPETLEIIERSLYYSEISNGKFDISICEVSNLWDFNNKVMPNHSQIIKALKNVDYKAIQIANGKVNANGKKIDLGSVAKGYIADKILEYLKKEKVENGIINLGGNVIVFGKKYKVGIAKPFSEENAAILKLNNKAVVTSGIYQRYIEQNGKIYHHILDTATGYGVENDLASVTVIGDNSLDCDALSTLCMLLAKKKLRF